MNKKLLGGLSIVLLIFIVMLFTRLSDKLTSNMDDKQFETKYTIKSSDEALKIIKSNKDVIIYYSQKDCVYCKELNVHLNKLDSNVKEKVYVFYIENEDKNKVKKTFEFSYTPTLIYYKNSKEIDRLNNDLLFKKNVAKFKNTGENNLKQWLQENEE
ncbi:hypothetical protein DOK67_0002280 [Enterococcus sp. DIV0212c]|uniref:thioredoxin family protein n=1 Tax=Enterococcus sp. DIV0212c TaxID=2230867 RepID=UPI001A9B5CF7|nr:thioredoxin family protein [Enterococcus sp. DIV0212c]MBO1355315.1 thioredoxin family protein [Enterococcus sp. DIV0212c]